LLPEKANFLLKFEYDDQSVVSRIKLKTLIETCCASKQIKAAMLNGKMGNDAGVPPSRQIRCALRRLQQACAVAGRSAKSRDGKVGTSMMQATGDDGETETAKQNSKDAGDRSLKVHSVKRLAHKAKCIG
jgi:hypothetical protein